MVQASMVERNTGRDSKLLSPIKVVPFNNK
jgi:hypothetical protein